MKRLEEIEKERSKQADLSFSSPVEMKNEKSEEEQGSVSGKNDEKCEGGVWAEAGVDDCWRGDRPVDVDYKEDRGEDQLELIKDDEEEAETGEDDS